MYSLSLSLLSSTSSFWSIVRKVTCVYNSSVVLWSRWNQKWPDWLTDWVTRWPIELSWTAKKVPEKLFQLQRPDGKPGRAFAPPEILWTALWERGEWCPSCWIRSENWQRCIDKIHQLIGDWQGHHISQVLSYRNENFTSVLSFSPFGRKTALYCDYTASGRSLEFIEDFIQAEVLTKRNLYSHWHVQ